MLSLLISLLLFPNDGALRFSWTCESSGGFVCFGPTVNREGIQDTVP